MGLFWFSVAFLKTAVVALFSPRLSCSKQGQLRELLRILHFPRGPAVLSDRAAGSSPELAMGALAQIPGTTITLEPYI